MILARPRRLLVLFALVFLLPLGLRPLFLPDEARYAEIAREMVERGDWIVPHLLGLNYFEKPVGGYWFNAVSHMLLGATEFAARLPTALATGTSAVLVGMLAHRLWADRRTTAVAVLVYLSMLAVAVLGTYITLDAQLTAWLNLSLVALHLATATASARGRLGAWALLGAACGMAFLTKGFVAWAVPVVIAAPFMLWQRRLLELLRYGPVAVVVAVLVAAPWAVAVHRLAPEFWNFFFWNEHVRRFAAEDAQHSGPFWFYLPVLSLGSIPWLGLVPPGVSSAWAGRREPGGRFLLVALLGPLLLFSSARGKLPAYVLVCFTPAALLLARAIVAELAAARVRWLRANAVINLALAVVAVAVLAVARARGFYASNDSLAWGVAVSVALAWGALAIAQWRWPVRGWELAALSSWLVIACLPFVFTQELLSSKQPSPFIAKQIQPLRSARAILCNDPGLCMAVAWQAGRSDLTLYQSEGEMRYGLSTPAGSGRLVQQTAIGGWIAAARRRGSVLAVFRVPRDEAADLAAFPPGAQVLERAPRLVIFAYPASEAP